MSSCSPIDPHGFVTEQGCLVTTRRVNVDGLLIERITLSTVFPVGTAGGAAAFGRETRVVDLADRLAPFRP